MFQRTAPRTNAGSAFALLELIYHATVRHVRQTHRNALIGLLMNMLQTIVFVIAFYLMFTVLGLRGNAVRGDFMLYIMSGIFLFLTHTKALGAVFNAEGPASTMMKHAPMNTLVAISSAALGTLYTQTLSLVTVLFLYHAIVTPIHIDQPALAMSMFILAWFSGCSIGLVFLAAKPWFPGPIGVVSQVYSRANMIASGKMFLANTMPGYMLSWFDWNPLFHAIDQARGFTFINYNPHFSSITYPIYLSLVLVLIGLMGDFYTKRHASVSWSAAR